MTALQDNLVEMFKWLVKYLDRNKINYYVINGTFLGTIRHQGFIPWDDDIDIGIPREDYDKFVNSFEDSSGCYSIEWPEKCNKDFLYSYCKFYNNNTCLIENSKNHLKRGIYIDIFPLDGIGNDLKTAKKNYKKINFQNNLLASKICLPRKGRSFFKNIACLFGFFIITKTTKIIKKINFLASSNGGFYNTKYVGNMMSPYRYKEIIERDIYGKPTSYMFEGIEVKGPEDFNTYLSILYGDWKKLPPLEKRVSNHGFRYLNLSEKFKN